MLLIKKRGIKKNKKEMQMRSMLSEVNIYQIEETIITLKCD